MLPLLINILDSESLSNTKNKTLQLNDREESQAINHIEEKLNRYLRKKALNSIQRDVHDHKSTQGNSTFMEEKTHNPIKKNIEPEKRKYTEKSKVKTEKASTVNESPAESDFCWRCLRRGHTGVACQESKTILGRLICSKCDKVGHNSEHCQLTTDKPIADSVFTE